ncbi:beta-ketothiolase BktB [Sphingomonas sp. BIUV-7]|uniref:Beta-ketothiolase BktB n=1 Tax=Sphingomonas natans TaxID=3063330 RepID=A0ABT8Y8L2_9SPHN|nr:beta-ketothiolase BktB [Sphingomonas sp. BIUV-7]MDO6414059.1 beta-ketothiolase BktB [Sphingomonas sp. BIUV-7]
MSPVYLVAGARTPIGSFGGSLKDFSPAELGAIVIREAVRRAALEPENVQHVVLGQGITTSTRDGYVARVAAVKAGIPVQAPALALNRQCGSGLQAIVSAAQMVALGECGVAVAGGTETMSRAAHVVSDARFGRKMGSITMSDALLEGLSDPFEDFHMGITAENVARDYQITRQAQDCVALESQQRASRAVSEGRFQEQIVAVEIKDRKGMRLFDTDEHVRGDASIEALAALRPAFSKDGTVTAGNASGINDGAAAVVLASESAVTQHGLKPMARILGWGHAGVEPSVMGIGPVKAVPIALERAGLNLDQIDVIESNEAFAAQAAAVAQQLGFDPAKTNPNGSGIALGHPVGATGAILTIKAMYELQRTNGRYGLVTMCIGGGQGIAMVIENLG